MSDSPMPTREAAGRCAYCNHEDELFFNGRRSICGHCWREHMGEKPPEHREGEAG